MTISSSVNIFDDTAMNNGDIKVGWSALESRDYDKAIAVFKAIVEDSSDHKEAYYGLGRAYFESEQILRAAAALTCALKIDRTDPVVFDLLGDVYIAGGQVKAAIENYGQASAYAQGEASLKSRQKLINACSYPLLKKINPNLRGMLIECLEMPGLSFLHFGRSWHSIVTQSSDTAPYLKLSKHKKYDAFKRSMDSLLPLDHLIEPLFLTGLGLFIVPYQDFERWCRFFRRYLLEKYMAGQKIVSDDAHFDFLACALMKYCYFTDYIFSAVAEEKEAVDLLEGRILKEKAVKLTELALYGCYRRVGFLQNAPEIEKHLAGGDHISQIPKDQIISVLARQNIKENIAALTPISDGVSADAREQYEVFPYPRWDVANRDMYRADYESGIRAGSADILNAGCGTGQEAIQLSYSFPDAHITAVDLSLSSLSYAIYKAQALGINNVRFMQGDILQLGTINQKFDYITSAGVLHHMEDPEAGWRILTNLLKPRGLMRIALYSKHARWAINDARTAIEKHAIADDDISIRSFRENIDDYLKYKSIQNIVGFYDYYNLPECRDLLFHVRETQYDLVEIKDMLDRLGLEFVQFRMDEHTIKKYKRFNKDDEAAIDLDSWAKFEEKNPNLFSSMYVFWCRKKD